MSRSTVSIPLIDLTLCCTDQEYSSFITFKELFNEEFYAEAEDEKPQFSDIGEDEFGEETNWDDYENYGKHFDRVHGIKLFLYLKTF